MSEPKKTIGSRFREFLIEIRNKKYGLPGGILLTVGFGLFLLMSGGGDKLKFRSYDLLFWFRPPILPNEAVMVFMDDASHKQLHQKYLEPWDRSYYTRFIKRLTAEKAKAVVFDVVFSDLLNTNKDQAFAEAIRENGNVILAADWVLEDYGGERKMGWDDPAQLFNESAADVGSDAMFPDADVEVRKYIPHGRYDKDGKPLEHASEAWTAAKLIGAPVCADTNREFTSFWLNYYAPEAQLPSVSFYKTIAENDPDVPVGYFSNKVVFVGARLQTQTQAARKDEYPSPYSYRDENKFMPGVAIHATAFLNLIRGDWLKRPYYVTERYFVVIMGLILGGVLVLCRPLVATYIALATAVPIIFGSYFWFLYYHYWFPWMIVVAVQIPTALIWSISYNSLQLMLEKARVEQSLGLYLSPKLVKKFAADPTLLKPGAKKQMLTILFSDIAGFTTISEGMDSDELAHAMNRYFQTAVTNCVHSTDGTVVKYIGDAIFAFWNAPEPQVDHAFRACAGALNFRNQEAQFVNGQELITRIGLHTGLANVGNFGSDTRVDYTAISENINLASRMEGLNKYLGTIVLITGETKAEVKDQVVTRYLGLFILKGFEKSVQVYELIGLPEDAPKTQALRDSFAGALQKFTARDFDGAEAAFKKILETTPKDGPCKFYLDQLPDFRAEPPDEDWKGEVKLKDK